MVAAILLLLLWALAVEVWQIKDYLLPSPSSVLRQLWIDRGSLLQAFWLTGQAAVAGLALSLLIGTLISTVFAQSAVLRYAFYPYAIFLQTVPIVAIAPLLVMWLGFGSRGVIAVAFVLSLFPIIANLTAGLTSVPTATAGAVFAVSGLALATADQVAISACRAALDDGPEDLQWTFRDRSDCRRVLRRLR